MKKRVLSLFMAFTLCFSMQPTVAFAGGTGVVTEQEAPSGENTTEVFTADSISGGDVSGGDAGVQDTEKDATLQAVQALINALPDEVTAENADELQAQLIAIDKALTELSEEQIAQLDMARCESICAALTGLVAVQDGEHNHPVCGLTCTHMDENGNPLHEDGVTWTPISTGEELLQKQWTKGNYYLTQNVALTEGWAPADGTVLCLNGYSITVNYSDAVIAVSSGRTFTLCNCSNTGMGTVTHGTGDNGTQYTGYGVLLTYDSTFNMYGGKISGNISDELGGIGAGVHVSRSKFNMYGGEISDNTSSNVNGGGGVYVEANSSFTMEGGSIRNNKVTSTAEGDGGGVHVAGGSFIMKGGDITGNTAYMGGGVCMENLDTAASSFTMTGGTITQNTASYKGGGVCMTDACSDDDTFTMTGGEITDNITENTKNKSNGGGVYFGGKGAFIVSGNVKITGNKYGDASNNVYLSNKPITIAGALTGSIGVTTVTKASLSNPQKIAEAGGTYEPTDEDAACFSSDAGYVPFLVDKEVRLYLSTPQKHPVCGAICNHPDKHPVVIWEGISDLGDIRESGYYYLTQNSTRSTELDFSNWSDVHLCLNGKTITGGNIVFGTPNPTLSDTLCDCDGGGKITGSTSSNGAISLDSGNLDMYGGEISGNSTLGMYVSGGTFNMYGGKITKNNYEGVDGYAGGVRVDADGTFNMYGSAEISDNTATFKTQGDNSGYYGAAGVYVNGGTFKMTENAEVSGNILTIDDALGSSSNNYAGGVYAKDGNVTVGGSVKITGNKKGESNSNVCLPDGKTITVGEALTDSASISVITETPIEVGDEAVIAVGTDTHMLMDDDLKAFNSDATNIKKEIQGGKIIFQNGRHWHSVCGEENCGKDGHGTDEKWKAISKLSDITASGSYYLKNDVSLGGGSWECTYPDVKLCLNGKKITGGSGRGAIKVVSGASLAITDCQAQVGEITQGTNWTGYYGISVEGMLTLWNGSITGNAIMYSGVYVANEGSFTMNGGNITGNKSGWASVYVTNGSFTMNGGSITGNTGTGNTAGMSSGGVYVENGSFTMNGGDITGNTGERTGGVYVADGTFTMNGGNITGNTGTGKTTGMSNSGGGVYVDNGTFNMNGGNITGNTSAGELGAGGVFIYVGTIFNMKDGVITGNNTTSGGDRCAGGVFVDPVNDNKFIVSGAAKIVDNWKNGVLENGVYRQGNNGTASNVNLASNRTEKLTITIEDAGLKQEARIGVGRSTGALPEAGEEVIIATGAADGLDYESIFILDLNDPYYSVVHDSESGNVSIRKHQHNWAYASTDGKTITATCNADHCPDDKGGSVTIAALASTLFYDGSAREAIVETSNDWQGPEVKDIAITYKRNGEIVKSPVNAGKYTASITLGGATASVDYEIDKVTLAASDFVFNKPENLIYDGQDKIEELVFPDNWDKKILLPEESVRGLGGTYTRFYKESDPDTPVDPLVDAGTYIVKIEVSEGTNYYGDTLSDPGWKFTIAPITTPPTVELSSATYTYTGKQITPEVTVKVDDMTLAEGKDYTVTYGDNKNVGTNVGTVTVTAKENGNYKFAEIIKEFTITQATPSGEPKYTKITTDGMTLADAGLTPDGNTLNPADGTLAWIDDAGNVLPDDTKVEANKTYKWRFIPADSSNYTNLTGEAELYHLSYTITASAGAHGSISPSGDVDVVKGNSQTFVIKADDGYEIESLTVDGESVNAAESYTFENVTAAHTIAVTFKIHYRIINGADSSWTQNTDGSLVIRGNGEFSKFVNVKVDGQILDSANYTVREGSTIVELKADYLKTLSEGSHTFELAWTDGSVSTTFTVARNTSGGNNNSNNSSNSNNNNNSNNDSQNGGTDSGNTTAKGKDPNTGDASHNVLWYLLTAMSVAGLAVMAVIRNKKKE